MSKINWTPEMEEQLFQLATDGRYTFTEIGFKLGCNKNQAIGKWHRLARARGIVLGKTKAPSGAGRHVARSRPSKPVVSSNVLVLRPVKNPAPAAVYGKVCGILEVTGCRWPVSPDDAPKDQHLFCNATQRKGSSYCEAHAREAAAPYSSSLIRKTTKSVLAILKKARAA